MVTHPIALVTGASSGIGAATAKVLADMGYALIVCGRRRERLETLCAELPKETPYQILTFDVRERAQVEAAWQELPAEWQKVQLLINNAGNAHGLDPIHRGAVEDWDAMLDGNVKGLLYVSKVVLPGMVEREQGMVINIGSIAGKEVYPNGNVYCASKHAVDALTQGMRMDLNPYNIRVVGIHPGLVETEFSQVRFKGDAARSEAVYSGYQPLRAEDVADTIAFVVSRPAHVVLADITILPTAQASAGIVKKSVPPPF
ncbi:MAG: SDR family NAD(P)-dependent oxidoreductase [Nitritalea sp.]